MATCTACHQPIAEGSRGIVAEEIIERQIDAEARERPIGTGDTPREPYRGEYYRAGSLPSTHAAHGAIVHRSPQHAGLFALVYGVKLNPIALVGPYACEQDAADNLAAWEIRLFRRLNAKHAIKADAERGKRMDTHRPGKVRELAEIMDRLHEGTHVNHEIPLVGPVRLVAREVPLDPYVLGILLGDGCFQPANVRLSTADAEILAAVRSECERHGGTVRHLGDYDYNLIGDGTHEGRYPQKLNSPIVTIVRDLGLEGARSHMKFVPAPYLFNDVAVRLAVLQGLLDSDGMADGRNGAVSFVSTSRILVGDVQFLVQSLGGMASITPRRPSCNGKEGRPAWALAISLPDGIAPFRLGRKQERVAKRKAVRRRHIASVESVGLMMTQCIAIAHPCHLYVTDDMIVTHNTHEQRTARAHRLSNDVDVDQVNLVSDTPHELSNVMRLDRKYALADVFQNPAENVDETGLQKQIAFQRAALASETAKRRTRRGQGVA